MLRALFFSALCGATLSAGTVIGDLGAGPVSGYTTPYSFTGQTFTVPTPDNVLMTWQFNVAPRRAEGSASFLIFDFTGSVIQFPPLYTTSVTLTTAGGVNSLTGLNLPLVSGQKYIAVYHLFTADSSIAFYASDMYSGGQGTWGSDLTSLQDNLTTWRFHDHDFAATFISSSTTPVPEPSFLPLLTIMMIIAAGSILRRRTISKRS